MRATATLMLEDTGYLAGAAGALEQALRHVPGVTRAYVSLVTEAAYVEYDTDRCTYADLVRAVESIEEASHRANREDET